MLREEQQNQYPFVKVDGFYVSAEEYNELKEAANDLKSAYQKVLKLGLFHNREHYDKQECCKAVETNENLVKQWLPDGNPIWAHADTPIWDPGVSVPEGFANKGFQETTQTIHGHEVKFTGKDCGYIDGEYFDRTEFTRRVNCFRQGWETPDDAVRAPQEPGA